MVHTQEPIVYPNEGADPGDNVTGWVGWVFFAGIIMFTGGFVNLVEGLVALWKHHYYLVPSSGLVVSLNYTTWGWILVILGLVLLFAGYGVMVGQTWARVVGVLVAVVNAVVNMVFMPAYPLWAVIGITLDVLVVYALVVHGRELKQID